MKSKKPEQIHLRSVPLTVLVKERKKKLQRVFDPKTAPQIIADAYNRTNPSGNTITAQQVREQFPKLYVIERLWQQSQRNPSHMVTTMNHELRRPTNPT